MPDDVRHLHVVSGGLRKERICETMETDITVLLETEPPLDEATLLRIFNEMGDRPYHLNIEDFDIIAADAEKQAPSMIKLVLDKRDGGRLEGMLDETKAFIGRELIERDIEARNVSVSSVPENPLEGLPGR